jgi:hypothetical protein
MLQLNDTLYFSSISFNVYHDHIWQDIYNRCDEGGKFFINISKRINPCRFVSRNGEWSIPWKQDLIPGFEMPDYDPNFKKSFSQICNEKALRIAEQIEQGKRFAVMYSGGIDSTVIMSALIKNLSTSQLASVVVCSSIESVIENPTFWNQYIHGKFKVLDSKKYKIDDLIEQGLIPITADEGDCMFGTLFGLTLYNNFEYYIKDLSEPTKTNLRNIKYRISDTDIHFSVYKDLIIKHLGIPNNPSFGRILYEKYVHNINTSTVPVHSLHDFFWWLIFNVKYLNCSVRGALYLNDRIDPKVAIYTVVNWFNDLDYQRWSMANNNNGQKIKSSPSTYKMAAREYIWDLDHNDWYKNFKIKLESLWSVAQVQDVSKIAIDKRPVARVGLTSDYKLLYINNKDVQDFYKHHLMNYKIDWI